MFLDNQSKEYIEEYKNLLKVICSLSKLFSENAGAPYLHYRVAERIFCRVFHADDLTRSDISIDAKSQRVGIGLKTFLNKNDSSLEKIAEFNKQNALYRDLSDEVLIRKISELRNERIRVTCDVAGVDVERLLYHNVIRDKDKLYICETPLSKIEIDCIEILKKKDNTISFRDSKGEYSFNKSKSTLYHRFHSSPRLLDIDIVVEEDPFSLIKELYHERVIVPNESNKIISSVVLALYSENKNEKYIPVKSGLNLWNAKGRDRNNNEVYIPIRREIHHLFPSFFPSRGSSFTLKLPNGNHISTKICQDGGKALMSNPNKVLGEWILRDILSWKEGELITYSNLLKIGIDSVQVNKYEDNTYSIDLKGIGSYEKFIKESKSFP